jgi:integrase
MTIRKKQNGAWYGRQRIRMPDGTRLRVHAMPREFGLPNTRVAATEALRRKVTAVIEGRMAPTAPPPPAPAPTPTPTTPTLSAFVPTYLEHSEAKNKASSVDSKRQILRAHIEPALGALPLDRVTFAAIEDAKHRWLATLKPKTVNNVLTVLRRLLALAAKRGLIAAVPEIEWLRAAKPTFDFLAFDEAHRLLAAADGEWRSMITVAARTGLRQGELLGLRWEDVDLVAGRLVVNQAMVRGRLTTPKSHKPREIPLGDDATDAFKAQRHLRGPLVWCDADGRVLSKGECKHPLWRACKRAGLRRIGWHVLRHTFASHLAMRGVPLKVIQELLGHASIAMTMRYAHLSPEIARDAVRLIDSGAGATATSDQGAKVRR